MPKSPKDHIADAVGHWLGGHCKAAVASFMRAAHDEDLHPESHANLDAVFKTIFRFGASEHDLLTACGSVQSRDRMVADLKTVVRLAIPETVFDDYDDEGIVSSRPCLVTMGTPLLVTQAPLPAGSPDDMVGRTLIPLRWAKVWDGVDGFVVARCGWTVRRSN